MAEDGKAVLKHGSTTKTMNSTQSHPRAPRNLTFWEHFFHNTVPKPKAAAMPRQRCGLNEGTAGRDAEAVASRMDRVGRL